MPFVWNVTNIGKLIVHTLALGGGAAIGAAAAYLVNFTGANLPIAYAGAVGAGIGDVARLLALELRKIDPMVDAPPLGPA